MTYSRLVFFKSHLLIVRFLLTLFVVSTPIMASAQGYLTLKKIDAQVAELQKEKRARTPAQKKLDSQLIYLAKEKRGESIVKGVPTLRAAVPVLAGDVVEVDITAKVSIKLTSAIKEVGGVIVSEVPLFDAIRAKIPVKRLEEISGREDVKFIQPAVYPTMNTGSVTSQGDAAHRAPYARSAYRATGSGVKVGVLSDSVEPGLAVSKGSGNLPSNVVVLPNRGGTGKAEGTAMLEIIHDLAPSASLFFATGGPSPAQMAQNILDLAAAGCHIIVDDIFFSNEPPFQDGVIATAVSKVSAQGVLYISCAANYGNLSSNQSGTWEGDFIAGGSDSNGTAHRFDGGPSGNFINEVGGFYKLWWSDPVGASSNDYDLLITDFLGNIRASSTNSQTGSQDPSELISDVSNILPGDYIYIYKVYGADRYLHLFSGKGVNQYATNGTTHGHNASGARNALTVAAAPAAESDGGTGSPKGPFPGPFTSANKFETFSSDGPRRVFFQANGTPLTPGNFSSSGGVVLLKPDITAADGVVTTLPQGQGLNPFFGTSAAAPHAAAIAALVKSKNPSLTATEIKSILIKTAIDISTAGWDRDSGYGIIMADRALAATPNKEIAVSGNMAFGGVAVGSTKSAALAIKNNGNTTLTVTSITCPTGFTATFSGSIPPGVTKFVGVLFKPISGGNYGGNIIVNSNRTSGQNAIAASGTGLTRIISLSGNLAFGNALVGATVSRVLSIKNSGNVALTVTSISYPAGFNGNFAGSIAAGATKYITVLFKPTEGRTYNGNFVINSNRTNGRNFIGASAVGQSRIIVLGGNLAFGNVPLGGTATRNLTIKNDGNVILSVSSLSLPSGFSARFAGRIAPRATMGVAVVFRPSAVTTYGGNVIVNSNRTSGRNFLAVGGNGVK